MEQDTLIVTTSWDDGHALDLKLARLLDKYGVKGTFYIPRKYLRDSLTLDQMRAIKKNHEIGAHTLSHVYLTECPPERAREEILNSKLLLEGLLAEEVKVFAYPAGRYNRQVLEQVKASGFAGARTVKNSRDYSGNALEFDVSLQAAPLPLPRLASRLSSFDFLSKSSFRGLLGDVKNGFVHFLFVLRQGFPPRAIFDWQVFALSSFKSARKEGKLWHLWGHSWEVDRFKMWQALERVLREVSNQDGVLYLTNSEALDRLEKREN